MASSSSDSELLDLDRGLPTTPEDVQALRLARRSRRLSTEDYLRALKRMRPPAEPERPRQRVFGGEPFRLTE